MRRKLGNAKRMSVFHGEWRHGLILKCLGQDRGQGS